MSITYHDNTAVFADAVSVEEAEDLLQWIQKHPDGRADLSACSHLHAADLQVLMAARIQISAWPRDESLKAWLDSAFPGSR
jgi:hypothetical protein